MCPPWWVIATLASCAITATCLLLHYQYNKMVENCKSWRTFIFVNGMAIHCSCKFWISLFEAASVIGNLFKFGLAAICTCVYAAYLFVTSIFRNFFYPPKELVVTEQDETLFSTTLLKTAAENHLIPPTTVYAKAFVAVLKEKSTEPTYQEAAKNAAEKALGIVRANRLMARQSTLKRRNFDSVESLGKRLRPAELKEEYKAMLPKGLKSRRLLLEVVQEGIKELEDGDGILMDDA
jgi:hypothetical protein